MRKLRWLLAGSVALALAVGSIGGATAQDEADADAANTGVVVKDTNVWWEDYGDKANDPVDGPVHWYGAVAKSEWDASDPRLSGDTTYREMMHRYQDKGFELMSAQYTVVNDDGSWTGTGYGLGSEGAEFGELDTVILHGAGAYDGLTAFLHSIDWRESREFRGAIVADGMPPFPGPVSD